MANETLGARVQTAPGIHGEPAMAAIRVGWWMACFTALAGCTGASNTGGPDQAGPVGAESERIARRHFLRPDPRRFHHFDLDDRDDRDAQVAPDATNTDGSGGDGAAPDGSGDATGDVTVIADAATEDVGAGDVAAEGADAGSEDAGGEDVSVASDAGAAIAEAGSNDAQQEGCLVPGTYFIPLTGTSCKTTVPGPPFPCSAVVTPDDTIAQIQLTFDAATGWTATPGGISAIPTLLTSTATGFTGTSSLGSGQLACFTTFTIDCQADTISITDRCVTATGVGCSSIVPLTGSDCSLNGGIESPPLGGVLGSSGQSGSAPLFDAGVGDGGAGSD